MKQRRLFCRISAAVLLAAVTLAAHAPAEGTAGGFCGENLTWTLSGGTLSISGSGPMTNWSGSGGPPWEDEKASITAVTVGDGVTSVGNYALAGCERLIAARLPDGLERIGASAFYGCGALLSLEIPDGTTEIGPYAFAQCGQLQGASLPDTLVSVGRNAFEGCASLREIRLPDAASSIGYAAFRGSGLIRIRLPASLETMGGSVFEACPGLTEVIWPAAMKTVPPYTFSYDYDPNGIRSFSLPEGVTEIGEYAFSAAAALEEIYLPASLQRIGSGAFGSCSALTDVYYAGTEEQKKSLRIGTENGPLAGAVWHWEAQAGECGQRIHHLTGGTCRYCGRTFSLSGLAVLELPASVTCLEEEALRGTAAQAVVFPEGTGQIGSLALADCPELLYVLAPEGTVLALDALEGSAAELLYY